MCSPPAGTLLRSAILLPLPGPFWGILTVMMAMEVVCAPNGVLTTAAIVASLPDSRDYGRLRAWGAVGWGIFSLVGGAVIARWMRTGCPCHNQYTYVAPPSLSSLRPG